jgi:N utilization substance protein A
MSQEIIDAVRDIEREKGIESGTLVAALEDALLAAYKKIPGSSRHATVEIDDQGDFRVYSIELPADVEERLIEEARERKLEELEALEAETGERSHTLISDDELDVDWSGVPEDQIKREDVTPENFGRIAAQTAKQVILQRIREAERAMMYDEYVDRVSEVVTGIVQQAGDRNNVLVDLGKVEALLPRSEQVDGERYEQGSRIKAVITEVRSGTKGPQVILSRRDPELIKTLFELEVPEIADGLVEIRGVAREPGYRSKIAVESHAQGVDPVGACVGPRGSRVRMVVSELRGEKIDIIPWNPEPARFVAKALSPARVREVYIDDDTKEATVVVPDDQLALAIGKEGLNARLAARLTGWRVDIQSDTEFAQAEAEAAYGGGEGEEFSGRCGAILSNGKRCPNEALPGSRYCGLPAHQELALHDSDDTEPIEAEEEPALEIRSDLLAPDAESVGPDSLQGGAEEAELLESEAPADIAAAHGPDATELAATEGEVDLDTVHPQYAEPERVPAGIPIEPTREADGQPEAPIDLDVDVDGRTMDTPSKGAAPDEATAPAATTEEGTPTA